MIDYSKEIKNELNKILPTYAELYVTKVKTPCITYRTNNNYDVAMANEDFGYSQLSFIIKLWGDDLVELSPKELEIDSTMRRMGFARTNSYELTYNNQTQKVFTYEATGYEDNDN